MLVDLPGGHQQVVEVVADVEQLGTRLRLGIPVGRPLHHPEGNGEKQGDGPDQPCVQLHRDEPLWNVPVRLGKAPAHHVHKVW
ncbi:hypothetical protein JCM17961_22510 [Endothiovibrio diazotrophicus]